MLRKPFHTFIVCIGVFLAFSSSALAESKLISAWHETDYSRARAHILQADEQQISLAVEINIVENYKTYWQSPGSTGVPPLAAISGVNIDEESVEIKFPHPHKYINKYGETWGYKDRAVLFVNVKRHDVAQNSLLNFNFDYAVCDVICLPEHAQFSLKLDADNLGRTMSALKFSKFHKQISQAVNLENSSILSANISAENKLNLRLKMPMTNDVFITDAKNRFYQHVASNDTQQAFNIHGLPFDASNEQASLVVYYFDDTGYFHTEIKLQSATNSKKS